MSIAHREPKKPKAKFTGANGNVFNLGAIASRALTDAGMDDKAKEMQHRVTGARSYDEALQIMMEYVDVR